MTNLSHRGFTICAGCGSRPTLAVFCETCAEPGTAIESQAKGLPAEEKTRRRFPGDDRQGSVPTSAGSSPLSHGGAA